VKQFLLFAGLLLCAGISCKKSNSGGGSYHVTATVDGKAETFNVNVVADKITTQGVTSLSIVGFVTSSPTGETMSLNLSTIYGHPLPIKVGTYSDTSTLFNVSGIYQTSITDAYLAGTSVFQASGSGSPAVVNHFKLVISALDSTSIKGTFSGDFFSGGGTDQPKKAITSGDFYAKLITM
jgi:hypothetical protein